MKQPGEPPVSWSNFSLRQDCYIGWNPPQGRSAAAGGQNPIFPGNPRKTWSLDRPRGGREQGIVRDEHGQEQPTDKERAQCVSRVGARRRSPGQSLGSRPARANVKRFHCARGGRLPLHAGAKGYGAADAVISVQPAIEESRCKPWPYPVEKRFHRRFSGRGSYGILRPLQRSGLVVWSPAGSCLASPAPA